MTQTLIVSEGAGAVSETWKDAKSALTTVLVTARERDDDYSSDQDNYDDPQLFEN
jgi:hypothetical protein